MKRIVLLAFLVFPAIASAQFTWSELQIPVRDGSTLAADLYSIDTTAAKPVILIQTPYNKKLYRLRTQLPPQAGTPFPLDTNAFNYVIVDWRGFFGSKDAPAAGYDRGLDGYDIVEWIAEQAWSNGKVGTWGPSALGAIQFSTARQKPPHLVCAVPMVKDFKTKYSDYYYGGEYRKSHVESLQSLGFLTTSLILSHPTNDLFVQGAELVTDYPDEFAVPMFIIGGWFDHYPDDVLRAYADIAARSDPSVRNRHRLMFGPWTHSGIGRGEQGELEYPNAEGTSDEAALQFFRYYLLGEKNGWENTPRVRYYQLGADEWREAESWEGIVERTGTTEFYLRPHGVLSSAGIGGPDFPPDTVVYDPRDPSPTYGGSYFDPFDRNAAVGPYDQRDVVESRSDALIYTTPPLERDLVVDGPTVVELVVRTDVPDTDLGVRLCDVYPDGRSMLLTQGIRRLRFRDGFRPADTSLVEPGNEYVVQIELQNLAVTFKAGHSLRIIVTGSNYPHFDVNPNTAAPLYDSPDSVVATTLIQTAPQSPSRVILHTPVGSGVSDGPDPAASSSLYVAPNPVTDKSRLHLTLATASEVRVDLFDARGRRVARPLNGRFEAGTSDLPWNVPEALSAGMYFCRLTVDGRVVGREPVMVSRK